MINPHKHIISASKIEKPPSATYSGWGLEIPVITSLYPPGGLPVIMVIIMLMTAEPVYISTPVNV